MRAFFGSPPGRATLFIYGAGVLLAWPTSLSWAVAALFLGLAFRQIRDVLNQRETEPAERPMERPRIAKARSRARAASCNDIESIDVNAVLAAALAAKPGG